MSVETEPHRDPVEDEPHQAQGPFSGYGDPAESPSVAQAASQRQYFGGPAEGRPVRGASPSARANDGSEHSGARP